jgi:hypothetical protein
MISFFENIVKQRASSQKQSYNNNIEKKNSRHGRSGFGTGSERPYFDHGRGRLCLNRGKGDQMKLKYLQKHFHRIVLKELNHCREEIKKIIYDYDDYFANMLCDACIKRLIHTEKRMNEYGVETEEPLDHEPYSLIPYFHSILQKRQILRKSEKMASWDRLVEGIKRRIPSSYASIASAKIRFNRILQRCTTLFFSPTYSTLHPSG